jgi:hypothetical protein
MKFVVCRSSEGAVSRHKPCAGASRGPEAPAWPGEYFWFIELNSLEELMKLLEKSGGGLGLWSPEPGEDHPTIEIFDEDEEDE